MKKPIALSGLILIVLLNIADSATLAQQQRHETTTTTRTSVVETNVTNTEAVQNTNKKNVIRFMPRVAPSKMKIIEHILSSSTITKTPSTKTTQQQQEVNVETREIGVDRRQYLDDLVSLMSSMLMRMIKTAVAQQDLSEEKASAKEKISTSSIHRVQSHRGKSSKSAQRQIADTVLNACRTHVKATDSVNEWHCELNRDFNSLDLQAETNFCSCSRTYECAESEQYSLDEIDMDDEELNDEENHAAVVGKCESAMNEATGESWNCTLSADGYGPHGESNMYCECETKKMCDFQKILYINELFKQSQSSKN